ncbi:MAG: YveK family protein [Erysipelotrichaceae bacterium]
MNNNKSNEDVIDLLEVLMVLKKNILLILFSTFFCVIIGCFYTFVIATPMYSASATIYLHSSDLSSTSEILQSLQIGSQLAPDYEVVLKSRPVVERVIESLNLECSVGELNSQVTISNPSDTHMIVVKVTDKDPELASDIANAYIKYGIETIREIDIKEPYIVESAIPNYQKVSPDNLKNLMISALIGILVSCGFIVVRMLISDRLQGDEKIERVLGVPVIAHIAFDDSLKIEKGGKKDAAKRTRK